MGGSSLLGSSMSLPPNTPQPTRTKKPPSLSMSIMHPMILEKDSRLLRPSYSSHCFTWAGDVFLPIASAARPHTIQVHLCGWDMTLRPLPEQRDAGKMSIVILTISTTPTTITTAAAAAAGQSRGFNEITPFTSPHPIF